MTDRESLQVQFKLTESARAERLLKVFFSWFRLENGNNKRSFDRNIAVMFARFGVFDGGRPRTFKSISQDHGVSLGRIRQIDDKYGRYMRGRMFVAKSNFARFFE